MKILVIAEHDNTNLKGSTNSTIAAAKEIGAPVSIKGFVRFALGEGVEKKEEDFAAEVAAVAGGS